MKGILTERSGVDLSETEPYEWNIPKARELLEEAGCKEGFKMKLFHLEKDYLTARFLQRFYKMLNIDVEITSVHFEWIVKHLVYPNTRDDYSWEDQEWWVCIYLQPAHVPELMGGMLEWAFHSGAAWQTAPDWLMLTLDGIFQEVLRTKDRDKRFRIYKKANEHVSDQALYLFTTAPLSLYGVNKELNFVPQISQYLYLDYSSVTDDHWSMKKVQN
jgi:ABC-type transport system substrate-binding protein